jgi:molybdate transport system substrate-binding protein
VKRARAISYSDPALGGGSANFFARLIEDLGVGDALRAKAVLTMPGEAGYPVGDGRAEYGVAQASELALVSGIDCVPLFPDAPKSRSVYAVGVSEASPNVAAARAFVAFLTSYEAKSVLNSKWLNVT